MRPHLLKYRIAHPFSGRITRFPSTPAPCVSSIDQTPRIRGTETMADATLPELEVLYILGGYQWRSGVNDVNRCSSTLGFRGERTGSMIPEALRLASDSPEVTVNILTCGRNLRLPKVRFRTCSHFFGGRSYRKLVCHMGAQVRRFSRALTFRHPASSSSLGCFPPSEWTSQIVSQIA